MDFSKLTSQTLLTLIGAIGGFLTALVTSFIALFTARGKERRAADATRAIRRREEDERRQRELDLRIDNLQGTIDDMQATIVTLRGEIKAERTTTADLARRVKSAEDRAKAAERRVNELVIENNKLKMRVAELEEANKNVS